MRKKVWLCRQYEPKGYSIFIGSKPYLSSRYWYSRHECIIRNLCCEIVKEWFDLKRHLNPGTCIQGYFNVSFKPIRRKK